MAGKGGRKYARAQQSDAVRMNSPRGKGNKAARRMKKS